MLETANSKTYRSVPRSVHVELEDAVELVRKHQADGKIVGMCHGCFDLLHFGHLRHFESAASMCDVLVVSLTADRFVNKGPDRPIFPAEQRAELVAGLACVDLAVISEFASAIEMLELLRPNRFFKGQDYQPGSSNFNPNFLKERDFAESIGAEVMHTQEEMYSSTEFLRRIQEV